MNLVDTLINKDDLKENSSSSRKQSEQLLNALYKVINNKAKVSYKSNDADKYFVCCSGILQDSNTSKRTLVIGMNVFLEPYPAHQFAMNFEKRHPEAKGNSEIDKLGAKEYRQLVELVELLKAVSSYEKYY